MPHYLSLSPSPYPHPGMYGFGAHTYHMPERLSFAVTSMTVPNGADEFHLSRRVRSQSVGWRNERESARRTRRPHAIILDEDPAILDILGQLLDEEDYDVTVSMCFLERDDVSPLDPDVIIADAAFNRGPDGGCLYEEPLKRPDGTAIPVVYSTTIPDVASRLSAMTLPILLKPFDLDTLLTLVRGAIPKTAR